MSITNATKIPSAGRANKLIAVLALTLVGVCIESWRVLRSEHDEPKQATSTEDESASTRTFVPPFATIGGRTLQLAAVPHFVETPTPTEQTPEERFVAYRDEVCSCNDLACVERVIDRHDEVAWKARVVTRDYQPGLEEKAATNDIVGCIDRIVKAEPPPKPAMHKNLPQAG